MPFKSLSFWFSHRGRVRRLPYFLGGVLAGVPALLGELIPGDGGATLLAVLPLYALSFHVSIMLAIKRAHDRGRPGVFVLLFLVPVVNLWPVVELLFVPGQTGDNAFGPEPRP